MEKYYHFAKQCFIKRYSKCGGNPVDGFKLIDRVKNLSRGKKVTHIISEEDLLGLEKILEYIN